MRTHEVSSVAVRCPLSENSNAVFVCKGNEPCFRQAVRRRRKLQAELRTGWGTGKRRLCYNSILTQVNRTLNILYGPGMYVVCRENFLYCIPKTGNGTGNGR